MSRAIVDEPQGPLEPVLQALPFACQQRLLVMGFHDEKQRLRDLDRLLRRAIGFPQPVRLIDLEIDPERWHGCYVTTSGVISWPKRLGAAAGLGRLYIDTSLLKATSAAELRLPQKGKSSTVSGILLADPRVRAAHRAAHQEPGGYGDRGLFIAALILVAHYPTP